MKRIYLDNAATTIVDDNVVKEMLPYYKERYGNASSTHSMGKEAKRALEESREVIAKSIRTKSDEIIFTSGGTESNNLVLKGLFFENPNKKHIITSKIEHDCILNACKWLGSKGFKITYLDVDRDGFVDPKDVERTITKDTLLVSVIHGNNEIGTVQDIKEIGDVCKRKGVYFHTDACQSYTKEEINVKKQNLDFVTLNSHKIHGPRGVGALFIRRGIKITPLLHGGGHEKKLRSGTENVPGVVGFARAVKNAKSKFVKEMEKLRDILIDGILKIPGTTLNGSIEKRLCNNVNVCFHNVDGDTLGSYLDSYGISTSTGSACSSHKNEVSHVLRAIGLSDKEANSSLRMSLSKYNTREDIDYALEILNKVIKKLK